MYGNTQLSSSGSPHWVKAHWDEYYRSVDRVLVPVPDPTMNPWEYAFYLEHKDGFISVNGNRRTYEHPPLST